MSTEQQPSELERRLINKFIEICKQRLEILVAFTTRTSDEKYHIVRHFDVDMQTFEFENYFPELYEKEASHSEASQQQVSSEENDSTSHRSDVSEQAEQQLKQLTV